MLMLRAVALALRVRLAFAAAHAVEINSHVRILYLNTASPTNGKAVLARVRSAHEYAGFGVDNNPLISTPGIKCSSDFVPLLGQAVAYCRIESGFQQDFTGGMPESR